MKKNLILATVALCSINLTQAQEPLTEEAAAPTFVSQVAGIAGRRLPKAEEVTYTLKQAKLYIVQLQSMTQGLGLNKRSEEALANTAAALDEAGKVIDPEMEAFKNATLPSLDRSFDVLEQWLARDKGARGAIPLRLRFDLAQAQSDLAAWFSAADLPVEPIACGQTDTGMFLPFKMNGSATVWLGQATAGYPSMTQCMTAVQGRQGDLVCTPDGGGNVVGYTPYSISRGARVGAAWGYLDLGTCNRALSEVYFGRICSVKNYYTNAPDFRYTYHFDLRTLKPVSVDDNGIGFHPGNDNWACRRSLTASRPTFACIPNTNQAGRWTGAALYRLTDQKVLTSFVSSAGNTYADEQFNNMQACADALSAME